MRTRSLTDGVVTLRAWRDADQIVVLDRGQVVEVGTYEELVLRGGRFATLAARDGDVPADGLLEPTGTA